MLLVVVGHAVEPLIDGSAGLRALYVWLYSFHVPAFVAISGHLSRPTLELTAARRVAAQLLWPYLLFQALYVGAATFLGPAPAPSPGWVTPSWLLWYLVSLLTWRLLLPWLLKIPGALVLSVALCLAAGAVPFIGRELSLSRTLAFLPLFVAGHLLPRPAWVALGSSRWRLAAAVAALSAAALAAVGPAQQLDVRWLYGRDSYAALGVTAQSGATHRLALLGVAAVVGLAFCAVVPARRTFFTALGRASLGVYLLHGLLLRALQWAGGYQSLYQHLGGATAGLLLVAGAVTLTFALAAAPVQRVVRPLLQPPAWLTGAAR